MELVRFNRKKCFCPTTLDVCRWLESAQIGNETIVMTEPVSFFETLESKRGIISLRDLSWVNKVCLLFLGREYKQPQYTNRSSTNTPSAPGITGKKKMNTAEEEKALRQISAANDRASVVR